jgi:hypothetical protein
MVISRLWGPDSSGSQAGEIMLVAVLKMND